MPVGYSKTIIQQLRKDEAAFEKLLAGGVISKQTIRLRFLGLKGANKNSPEFVAEDASRRTSGEDSTDEEEEEESDGTMIKIEERAHTSSSQNPIEISDDEDTRRFILQDDASSDQDQDAMKWPSIEDSQWPEVV